MVNFGLNSASILGIFLAVAGASLYFLRSVRPEVSRDHDIFFAAVGLLCGFILLFQGWRLDPILQFGQFLLSGSAIFFAVESIRLRGVATEQARRNSKIVDDDRPVSSTRVYRAELDQLEPYDYKREEEYDNPRLRGYQEPRSNRRPQKEETPPRPSRPRNRPNNYTENPTPKSRPTRPRNSRKSAGVSQYENQYENQYEDDWREIPDHWEDEGDYPETNPRPSRSNANPNRPKSNRPSRPNPLDMGTPYNEDEDISSADYVDYQPLEDDDNNPSWDEEDSDRDWKGQEKPRNPINFDY
jgi:hypothetical protein